MPLLVSAATTAKPQLGVHALQLCSYLTTQTVHQQYHFSNSIAETQGKR